MFGVWHFAPQTFHNIGLNLPDVITSHCFIVMSSLDILQNIFLCSTSETLEGWRVFIFEWTAPYQAHGSPDWCEASIWTFVCGGYVAEPGDRRRVLLPEWVRPRSHPHKAAETTLRSDECPSVASGNREHKLCSFNGQRGVMRYLYTGGQYNSADGYFIRLREARNLPSPECLWWRRIHTNLN